MPEQDVEPEARSAEQDEFEPPGSFVEQANVSDSSIGDGFVISDVPTPDSGLRTERRHEQTRHQHPCQ
jgi:hypothetical protein